MGNYIPNLVWICKIPKRFLCVDEWMGGYLCRGLSCWRLTRTIHCKYHSYIMLSNTGVPLEGHVLALEWQQHAGPNPANTRNPLSMGVRWVIGEEIFKHFHERLHECILGMAWSEIAPRAALLRLHEYIYILFVLSQTHLIPGIEPGGQIELCNHYS